MTTTSDVINAMQKQIDEQGKQIDILIRVVDKMSASLDISTKPVRVLGEIVKDNAAQIISNMKEIASIKHKFN